MKDIINLISRGSEKNYLKKLSNVKGTSSNTYVLKTSSYYMRGGETSKGNKFIDPAGGPMIIVGEYLEEAKAVVKFIDFVVGYGYIITFE